MGKASESNCRPLYFARIRTTLQLADPAGGFVFRIPDSASCTGYLMRALEEPNDQAPGC